MPKLTLLRGYSAGGKSTWARANNTGIIVSRDVIRPTITGHSLKTVLDSAGEALVTKIEHAQIETALRAGVDVIVDNTNLNPKFARAYLDLAVKNGAAWEVKDFTTPVEECVSRNNQRNAFDGSGVPTDVIWSQVRRYPMPWPELTPTVQDEPWQSYVPDTTLPAAWVFDLDGTLAKIAPEYSPYDENHYLHDTVREHVLAMLWGVWNIGDFVILLSGRPETNQGRGSTEWWLGSNGIDYDELYMRPGNDHRLDAIVKSELFDTHLRDRYWVRGVFDDRPSVIRMWRARNIPVFDVGKGKEF